ncbi:Rap1a/Tai family immunity protein [Thalassotalea piscium]
MYHFNKIIRYIMTIGLVLTPSVVLADFKTDIIDSCKAYQQGKDTSRINACKLYIDGFIDSALITEDAVIKPRAVIAHQKKPQSDYLKRAYKTRLLTTSSMLPNEDAHQFCIPKELERQALASMVAKSIDINKLANKSLKEVLFDTLIEEFPCKE